MTAIDPYKPTVPTKLRAAVYYIGIALAFAMIIIVGVFAIFFAEYTIQVAAMGGVVNTAWLYLSNQLAVNYLPPQLPAGGNTAPAYRPV